MSSCWRSAASWSAICGTGRCVGNLSAAACCRGANKRHDEPMDRLGSPAGADRRGDGLFARIRRSPYPQRRMAWIAFGPVRRGRLAVAGMVAAVFRPLWLLGSAFVDLLRGAAIIDKFGYKERPYK